MLFLLRHYSHLIKGERQLLLMSSSIYDGQLMYPYPPPPLPPSLSPTLTVRRRNDVGDDAVGPALVHGDDGVPALAREGVGRLLESDAEGEGNGLLVSSF